MKVLVPVSEKVKGDKRDRLLAALRLLNPDEIVALAVIEPAGRGMEENIRSGIEIRRLARGNEVIADFFGDGGRMSIVKEGPVVETIAEIAAGIEADLIAMFSDGNDSLSDFVLGSITERVMKATDKPVLVVR